MKAAKKLSVLVIDLVAAYPNRSLWGRVMHANFSSIMPQVVAFWCEQEGHDVHYFCFTGSEDIISSLPKDPDVVIIGAFTSAAQFAYAISNFYRKQGAVTIIGGPHARCFPGDARKYFDYAFGFTNRQLLAEALDECAPHRPLGRVMSAPEQPKSLPGVQERWKFIELALQKAPFFKIVPMIGSLGCPYTCNFCVDALVDYQPMDYDVIKSDLTFLLSKFKRPIVGWHDPNFGIRFNDYMDLIEDAVPPGRISFFAESSMSLLSEANLKRLQKNGFVGILPGIESWYSMGNKSKTRSDQGEKKLLKIADHVNLILSYIPFVQSNFVFGLDWDQGPEPFELTKRFVDLVPGTFPAYNLLTAYGESASMNLQYYDDGRVIGLPFHFLDCLKYMNVTPKHYSNEAFYEQLIGLARHTFSRETIRKRFKNDKRMTRWVSLVRTFSFSGFPRIRFFEKFRRLLQSDSEIRAYFNGEQSYMPALLEAKIKHDLGSMWPMLPENALYYDLDATMESLKQKDKQIITLDDISVNEE